MKKFWITLLVLALVGTALATAGFFLGASTNFYFDRSGFHMVKPGEGEKQENMRLEEFGEVKIDTASAHIEIIEGDSYGIYIENNGSVKCEYRVKNGVLHVEQPHMFGVFLFNWRSGTDIIKVYVPKGKTLQKADVDFASGKLDINGVGCDDIDVDMASGKSNISNLRAGKVKITYTSGTATLENVTADNAKFEYMSGGLKMNGVTLKKLDIESTSGNADIEGAINGDIDIDMMSGSVKMALDTPEKSFSKKIDKLSGSVKINGEQAHTEKDGSAPYELDIDITSGSVNIDFKK